MEIKDSNKRWRSSYYQQWNFWIVLLENHWDRWLDIYQNTGGRVSFRGCSKRKENLSQIQPNYTRGRLMNGKQRDIGTGKG